MQLSCKLAYKINSALVCLVQINHCSHLRKKGEYDFDFTAVEETDLGKPEAQIYHTRPYGPFSVQWCVGSQGRQE